MALGFIKKIFSFGKKEVREEAPAQEEQHQPAVTPELPAPTPAPDIPAAPALPEAPPAAPQEAPAEAEPAQEPEPRSRTGLRRSGDS